MIKKLTILLLITSTVTAQDKGKFESYSNPFYGKIVSESDKYDKADRKNTNPLRRILMENKFLKV